MKASQRKSMMKRFAGLLCAALLGFAAPSHAQAPKALPPAPASATFPGAAPAQPPAPPATPPPGTAPQGAAPTEAPGAAAPAPAVPGPASDPAAPATAPDPAASAPVAAPAAAPAPISEPPAPPPRSTDDRPNRAKRPLFIGGELGWNGLAGFGVNFSYHPIPQLALDSGLGVALPGLRVGLRARFNFLTSEWTPFVGVGVTYSPGTDGEEIELESGRGKVKLVILPSTYVQLAGGVNYTGDEGFVFMATSGYAMLVDSNTSYRSGSREAYVEDMRPLYRGGLIVSVAFGYAF